MAPPSYRARRPRAPARRTSGSPSTRECVGDAWQGSRAERRGRLRGAGAAGGGGPGAGGPGGGGARPGLLPDLDRPRTTISRSFGFLTEWFAWLVDRLSGGHRHGTHSLLGITVFTAAAYGAGLFQLSEPKSVTRHIVFSWHIVPAALVLALLYSAALRALKIGGHYGDLLGIAGAVATSFTGADLTQLTVGSWHAPLLAVATALGCAAHIAGDELTHGGCPLLWPVSMHEFHLLPRALQITTANVRETWVVFPLLLAGLAVAVWHATGHPLAIPQPSK